MVASLYGVDAEQPIICVVAESAPHQLEPITSELLTKGRELAGKAGWELACLLLGHENRPLADEAFAYGAQQVWLADHPLLDHFTIEAFAAAAFQAIDRFKPSVTLFGATPNSRDLAGRLAVRLRTGLNADCSDLTLNPDSGVLTCQVSGFGGGVLALIEAPHHRPQMATIRPGVFSRGSPDYSRSGQLLPLEVEIRAEKLRTHVLRRVSGESVDLTRAAVLVAGGRGMEGDFDILRRLAEHLGGEVGATRPPVDEGHIERERQIGQTGVVCSPDLALCCGISGAFHFVVGIEKAGTVIAVNSDPQAPIFEFSDYCIVGDVHQIIPALLARLEKVPNA
jgi:electron transfer flavoprotein alpha subunit